MKIQTNILLWEAKLPILKCLEKNLNRYFTKGDHVEVSKDFIADTVDKHYIHKYTMGTITRPWIEDNKDDDYEIDFLIQCNGKSFESTKTSLVHYCRSHNLCEMLSI